MTKKKTKAPLAAIASEAIVTIDEFLTKARGRDRSIEGSSFLYRGQPHHKCGYRGRVADQTQQWFSAEPRRDLEQELWDVVTREWESALGRLSSLLETDATGAETVN